MATLPVLTNITLLAELPRLVVLADIGPILGLLVFLFTIVGWLVNLANNNQPQNQPPQRRPQGGPPPGGGNDPRVQNEIEVFLQEVRGQRPPARPPKPANDDFVIEVVDEQPKPRRTLSSQLKEHRAETAPSEHSAREVKRARDKKDAAEGKKHSARVTFASTSPNAMRKAAEAVRLKAAGQQSPGLLGGEAKPPARTMAVSYAAMLQNPAQVKQAIVINEILSRPKSLRKS